MKKNLAEFVKISLKNLLEAIFNLFIFLPYFFSVTILLKTLFAPWKNLMAKKTSPGFSINEWFGRLSFNLISCAIGFSMRASILIFYFLFQLGYIIFLPFIFIIFIALLPLMYVKNLFEKTEEEKKALFKKEFFAHHLLKQENYLKVENWFEWYHKQYLHRSYWWRISNLFSQPPLARDWSVGYTPALDEYADELTSATYQRKIVNIVDRKKEIEQIERILSKNNEANIVIVGEEGVGKHTIIDALAKRIYEGHTNPMLAYKRILKINMEKVLNISIDQKQRENLLETLLQEASYAKNIIILIENIDKYIAFGQDRVDLSLSIEKFAKTNLLQLIGTTTPFFYQKFVFTNEKINRIFTKLDVREIDETEAETILLQLVPIFERRNRVIIPYETVKNVVEKSEFYITYIPFPEKAIDLLDNACVYYKSKNQVNAIILPETVDIVLSEKTHIPTRLTDESRNKLINLEQLLSSRIVSQTEAIKQLSSALRRSFLLLGKRKKPLACFLLLGPTGVGKTETAKALAEIFFGSEKHLIRFDMSQYQSKKDIPNLIGSAESNNPGLMTETIRNNPYAVLLLDEIEKADRDLINIFLTVLDEGYFTDGAGKRVDCKNLIIIATSNAGADFIYKQLNQPVDSLISKRTSAVGQKSENRETAEVNEGLINYLIQNHIFSPEFLNRFDGVVIYGALTPEYLSQLAQKIIGKIADNIYKLYRVKIAVSDQTINELVNKGYDKNFGARNLQRVIAQDLEDKIAKLILERKITEGETVNL